jgi:hypothetical protein
MVGRPPAEAMNTLLVISLLFASPSKLALFRQWSKSPSPELRVQAVRLLHGMTGRESRAALLSMLDDGHPGVRAEVRGELVKRAGPLAAAIAGLRSARARLEGVRVLLARGEDPSPMAADRDAGVRARVLASKRLRPAQVRASLKHPSAIVRALALEALRDPLLARDRLRRRACTEERIAAARVVDDTESLARLLGDRSWRVRLAAIRAAERRARPELMPALIRVLKGAPGRVRARAAEALERLTQAPFGESAVRWEQWWGRRGPNYVFPKRRESTRTGKGHSSARVVFRRIPVVSHRVCFVLDASRSMNKPAPGGRGKSRWELVVRDLLAVVDRLPKKARFNVILFRTGVEAWKKHLVKATPGMRRSCREWISKASPKGWTNLYDALALALADDDVDAVYVLTDGVPSRGTETKRKAILDEFAFLNHFRLVQINCVQAGGEKGLNPAWRGFLEELAAAHDGVSVRE